MTYRRSILDRNPNKRCRKICPLLSSNERVSIQIKFAIRSKARDLKEFVGNVDDILKDNGPIATDLDLGTIVWVGVRRSGNASLQLLKCVNIGYPFAFIGVEIDDAWKI